MVSCRRRLGFILRTIKCTFHSSIVFFSLKFCFRKISIIKLWPLNLLITQRVFHINHFANQKLYFAIRVKVIGLFLTAIKCTFHSLIFFFLISVINLSKLILTKTCFVSIFFSYKSWYKLLSTIKVKFAFHQSEAIFRDKRKLFDWY